MAKPLELDDGKNTKITYEFNPAAIFEEDGKSYGFISFKKISSFKKKDGEKQTKYQNFTVKPAHKEEFTEWLQECLDELKGVDSGGDDVPF